MTKKTQTPDPISEIDIDALQADALQQYTAKFKPLSANDKANLEHLVSGSGAPLPAPGVHLTADRLAIMLRAAHRAGQECGRLLGKESWDRAADYADSMMESAGK